MRFDVSTATSREAPLAKQAVAPRRNVRCAVSAGVLSSVMSMWLAASVAVAQSPAQPATTAQATPTQSSTAGGAADATRVGLELNKMEPLPNGCRAYMVIDNQADRAYTALKLDLVLFQTDGIIGRRVALDLAPVRAQKRSVKLFDLDGMKCDDIASLLINDVMDCRSAGADGVAAADQGCLERLALSSRSKVQLSK